MKDPDCLSQTPWELTGIYFGAIVIFGDGVPRNCRKADDSYCTDRRLEFLFAPPRPNMGDGDDGFNKATGFEIAGAS